MIIQGTLSYIFSISKGPCSRWSVCASASARGTPWRPPWPRSGAAAAAWRATACAWPRPWRRSGSARRNGNGAWRRRIPGGAAGGWGSPVWGCKCFARSAPWHKIYTIINTKTITEHPRVSSGVQTFQNKSSRWNPSWPGDTSTSTALLWDVIPSPIDWLCGPCPRLGDENLGLKQGGLCW